MTQFLPPNLLALFAARDPIPFKSPTAQLSWEKDRARNPYTGVATLATLFEDPKDTPPPTRGETKDEKKVRRIKEKAIIRAKEIDDEVKTYDPHNNKDATADAFKTLFVARINYDTSESKLRREFDMYGPIRKITMVKDSNGKPRGYAFIEFEHERDMHTAYKSADGKKIDGRRVLVDVERGRTVKGWRPRRLGGGLGSTRRGANDENAKHSGRTEFGRSEREDERREPGRSGSRERRRPPSREKDRRDRRDRERPDRDRDRDRDRRREKDRDRGDRDRGDRKDRDRDRDRKHKRDRSKERERDGSRRKRSKERDRKDRDRSDRDKDRKSRSDRGKDDERREPKQEYPDGEAKSEHNNGTMEQGEYEGREMDQKQEADYNNYQESYGEKGQGDFQNSESKAFPPDAQKQEYRESDNMEY